MDSVSNPHELLNNRKILIAEDHPDMQILFKMIIERHGAKTIIASNGKEVVDIVDDDHSIDAILMDLQMPVMDGFQATEMLRNNNFKKPIVAVTILDQRINRDKCLDVGFSAYFCKLGETEDLISLIKHHICM